MFHPAGSLIPWVELAEVILRLLKFYAFQEKGIVETI